MNTFGDIADVHPSLRSFSDLSMPLSNEALRLLKELKAADAERAESLASEIKFELRYLLSHDMAPLDEECSRAY